MPGAGDRAARPAPTHLRRRSASDLALFAEAWLTLAFSTAAIRVLPFASIGRLASRSLGRPFRGSPQSPRVAWAVKASATRSPWRAVCFQQGLATQIMLRRRGIDSTLYFGAAPGQAKGLSAHVWVRSGQHEVIGCEDAARFAVLAKFPSSDSKLDARLPSRFGAAVD